MRTPIIDSHCHFLSFSFIPREMVKLLSGVPKLLLKHGLMAQISKAVVEKIVAAVVKLDPSKEYDRVKSLLDVYYMREISSVVDWHMRQMRTAKIDICVPLMMDLFHASPTSVDPDLFYYEDQINMVSAVAARYPWRVFPFVMFDPRRPNAMELVKTAINAKGFIGVKMYPALGYFPSPAQMERNDPGAAQNLRELYEFCRDGRIPITTHASPGGAYSTGKRRKRDLGPTDFTAISNWHQPIEDYSLKVNFAHCGGDYLANDQSRTWQMEIFDLMRSTSDGSSSGQVFADLSYHDMAQREKTASQYFADLRNYMDDPAVSKRLLFGTDASMISHTWTQQEYIRPFRQKKNLCAAHQARIFIDNPITFLFDDGQLPEAYIAFLSSHSDKKGFENPPPWIKQRGSVCTVEPVEE